MNTEAIFTDIESHRLAAEINVASSISLAIKIAFEQEPVRALAEVLHDKQMQGALHQRTRELASRDTDFRFENPFDAALLVYLALLRQYNRRLAFSAAAVVARISNTWWAKRFAGEILRHPAGDNQNSSNVLIAGNVVSNFRDTSAGNAGDAVFVFAAEGAWIAYNVCVGSFSGSSAMESSSRIRWVQAAANALTIVVDSHDSANILATSR